MDRPLDGRTDEWIDGQRDGCRHCSSVWEKPPQPAALRKGGQHATLPPAWSRDHGARQRTGRGWSVERRRYAIATFEAMDRIFKVLTSHATSNVTSQFKASCPFQQFAVAGVNWSRYTLALQAWSGCRVRVQGPGSRIQDTRFRG